MSERETRYVIVRFSKRLILLLKGTMLLALVLVATYVSVGRIIVGNIDGFRVEIEQSLSKLLNTAVSIAAIDGTFRRLDPQIYVDRLVVGDPNLPVAAIAHVTARVDALASVRERRVVLRDVNIEGLSFTLRQQVDGTWNVDGMSRGDGSGLNLDPLLTALGHLQFLGLSGVDIEVKGQAQSFHLSNQADKAFELVEVGGNKHLTLPLSIQRAGDVASNFELLGRFRGDPRANDFFADLYLRLPPIDLTDFLPRATGSIQVSEFMLEGELWLTASDGRFDLRALPRVNRLAVAHGTGDTALIAKLSARLHAAGAFDDDIQVSVAALEGTVGTEPWSMSGINVGMHRGSDNVTLAAELPAVDVAALTRALLGIGSSLTVIDEKTIAAIREIDPGGKLTDALVTASFSENEPVLRLAARINDGHLQPWRGSPGISSLNAFVLATPDEGYIEVHNERFLLEFAPMFAEPWPFDSGRGRVYYQRTTEFVRIYSDLIHFKDHGVTASGRFSLNLPPEKSERTWALEVGIEDADLKDVRRYLPDTLSDNLSSWLKEAIIAGKVKRAGLLFHGPIGKEANAAYKLFELHFDVADATLAYHPIWPQVERLNAGIYVGNWGVYSGDARGSVLNNAFHDGVVNVAYGTLSPADTVLIEAAMVGGLADGLRLLTETPVSAAIGHIADDWHGEGALAGTLRLDIPIGGRQGEAVDADVVVDLNQDKLRMPAFDLDVAALSGRIRYQSVSGLSSPGFTAALFGKAVTGSIVSDVTEEGGTVAVAIEGEVDVSDLYAWSKQPVLTFADGVAAYRAAVHVPYGGVEHRPFVEVWTDLSGVATHLPPPIGKHREESLPFRYRQTFLQSGTQIDFDLGELTHASFLAESGAVRGGRFHFGREPMGVVAYDKMRISGDLDELDYDEWKRVTRDLDQQSEVSLHSAIESSVDSIDLNVKELSAMGLSLDRVTTRITRDLNHWNIRLNNDVLAGEVRVPDQDHQPLVISLDYLRLHSEDKGQKDDPLLEIKPSDLVDVDISVDKLELNGDDFGSWSFDFRPTATGAVLEHLTAQVKGLSVGSDSVVTWRDQGGVHSARFDGAVQVHDLGQALRQWGFASSIEGQEFKFDAGVSWQGSPAMISAERLSGLIHLREGSGRFVQAESGTGALKLLGIFDFASLSKRFRFDFFDVVQSGLTFTEIKGSARFDQGIVHVVDPIVIVGAGSTFKVGGSLDLKTNSLDNDMIVTLPVSRNLPWYAAYSAIVTGPLVGAGVWLAQKVFETQINQMTSAKYRITGTVDKPIIEFDSIFSDSVREAPAELEPETAVSEAATGE